MDQLDRPRWQQVHRPPVEKPNRMRRPAVPKEPKVLSAQEKKEIESKQTAPEFIARAGYTFYSYEIKEKRWSSGQAVFSGKTILFEHRSLKPLKIFSSTDLKVVRYAKGDSQYIGCIFARGYRSTVIKKIEHDAALIIGKYR